MMPRKAWQAAFVAAVAAVSALSLWPRPEGHVMVFTWQDKLEHALAYAGMGVLGLLAWPGRRTAVAVALLAHGALIELAQSTTAHRLGDPADWLADALGVGIALWLVRRR